MSTSCKGLALELVKCLSETDCVKVQKRPYRECAGEKVPCITSECVGLRETYFNCKRGQVCFPTNIPVILFWGYSLHFKFFFKNRPGRVGRGLGIAWNLYYIVMHR
ncbi:uncharacterized protein LOC109838643 [Asparagus officinalis]|uniref:uncharacterized protein LOC109838643 n=1 Tax=Asparagus officinalis TaxID=4686 RepID=UPI00098E512D|nr:uncharacterized protein LOC109838643 [Asparagus officinalis]